MGLGGLGDPNDPRIKTRRVDGIPSRRNKLQVGLDCFMASNAGFVTDVETERKFGYNPNVGTSFEDVWSLGGDYDFWPATAQSMEVVSADPNDANGGTGAHSVQVFGLDANWELQDETVTLNGGTVAMTKQFLRVWRSKVLASGSSQYNEGDITVQVAGGGTAASHIEAERAQSLQTNYSVQADHDMMICDLMATVPSGKSVEFVVQQTDFGSNTWRTVHIGYLFENFLPVDGHTIFNLAAKSDWRVRAKSSAAGTALTCWWNGIQIPWEGV